MLIDAPPTLSNTIMHHKHLSHLMAKSMNELGHKSPLILSATEQIIRLRSFIHALPNLKIGGELSGANCPEGELS